MSEPIRLELRRLPGERNAYQLGDVGTVHRRGPGWRSVLLRTADRRWTCTATGLWRVAVQAIDDTGGVAGEYLPRALRGGGTLRWYGRHLALRPTGSWRQRYALVDAGRDIVTLEARSCGRRPVTMTVLEAQHADPGVLLFTAVLAVWSASDAAGAAAAGVAATSATWMG